MPETLIKVDLKESPYNNPMVHNRWHPDIPIATWVNPGDDFILETYDWTGGAIKNDDSADDVRDVDLTTVHFLSGPVGVKGCEPGDLLVVDLLDIGARDDSLWGFNGFFSKTNGGGFLTEHFPHAQKSIWDFNGMFTKSRHIPGVEFAGLIHPGLIGCLPDQKMLDTWNEREVDFIATQPDRVPPLANPPFAKTAHAGKATGDAKAKIAAEGARTVPPREHGGNLDNKELTAGTTLFLPVWAEGALFSAGDGHGVQGDGEVCINALEICLTGTFTFVLHKSAGTPLLTYPRAETATHFITMGMNEDLDQAMKQALRQMIAFICSRSNLSREQAYQFCSLAVDFHVTQTVNGEKGVHGLLRKGLLF